jgi:Ca2+-binding RTX toxin-like protein
VGTTTVTAGAGDTDLLVGIENIIAGSGDDHLAGDATANLLDGGAGSDTVDYTYVTGAASGFTVTLDTGGTVIVAVAQGSDVDTLVSIENIVGGGGDDVLAGDGEANTILGGDGADVLDGGDADNLLSGGAGGDTVVGGFGADLLDGGDNIAAGHDVVDYALDPSAGAGISLVRITGTEVLSVLVGFEQDSLVGVEEVRGGDGDDTLSMWDALHADPEVTLLGGNGSDLLVGRRGSFDGSTNGDTLGGGTGSAVDTYGLAGRFEVATDTPFADGDRIPTLVEFDENDFLRIHSGASYAGDIPMGLFEFVSLGVQYSGDNSGIAPGIAALVVDADGLVIFDADSGTPGYSVLARVDSGAGQINPGNIEVVSGPT